MRVAAYVHYRRTMGHVTGVGRHINGMVLGLSRMPGLDVTVMAPRQELQMNGTSAAVDREVLEPGYETDSPLAPLPKAALPLSRAMMERLWWLTNLPKAERYVPDADWVYSPADAYVPTKKALLASTIHDIDIFEDDLPWSNAPYRARARRNWRLRLAPIFKHARLVLTVSEFSKQRMVELLGADANQISVIGNGVDDRFFAAGASPDDDETAKWRRQYGPYLIMVGGLVLRKGAPYMLRVAEELQKAGSELRLVISGKSEPQYAQQARALPNIVQLGFVADERLPALLKGAASMLFLSRYEGFGMPIVEAMACGTPAIVSRFSALPEVAGDAGIVVDVEKPAEIARLAMRMASEDNFRREYSLRGLERARQFTWQACVERLTQAMRQSSS